MRSVTSVPFTILPITLALSVLATSCGGGGGNSEDESEAEAKSESESDAGTVGEGESESELFCTDQLDCWNTVTPEGAPDARVDHIAVWTGTEMIVWGGESDSDPLIDGGRYNPSTDMWLELSDAGNAMHRRDVMAIWATDCRADDGVQGCLVVWGGESSISNSYQNDGAKYDPVENNWSQISTKNAPSPRGRSSVVWTGREMIVWGGLAHDGFVDTGARYNPVMDSWTVLGANGVLPTGRELATAVWTGSEMIIWGGSREVPGPAQLATGGRYLLSDETWLALSEIRAPAARYMHKAVWTDTVMVVWGGFNFSDQEVLNSGGLYDSGNNTWSPTQSDGTPGSRSKHTMVWTGSEVIVWGGSGYDGAYDDGGRYNPLTNVWSALPADGSPGAQTSHSAVWADHCAPYDRPCMIVWGGWNNRYLNHGAKYFPPLP